MTIEPLGDSAFIVRDLPGPAYAYAEALLEASQPEILDANASYETLGIYTRPGGISPAEILAILSELKIGSRQPNVHTIPVLYDGEDLASVASALNLPVDDVVLSHSSSDYQCFAVGFCPGFPYLGWLPEMLQGIPRLPTPRTRTEAGSVAITGKQTAVYPLVRPGGWPIIGRTPITLVDVDDNYFPIRAGDIVRFRQVDEDEFLRLKGERL